MTRRTAIYFCLTCAALAFLAGAVAGMNVAANDYARPPAGQQFDDGPVIVRAPVTTVRFIF